MKVYIQDINKCEECPYIGERKNGKYCFRASTPSITAYIKTETIPKWCPLPDSNIIEDFETGYDNVVIRKNFNGSEILS